LGGLLNRKFFIMTKLRFLSLQVEDYCRNNGLELTVSSVIIALVALGYIDLAAQHGVEPTVESDDPLPADKNLKARIKLL